MIVVSDSSPLIALSAVARLDLLRELYGRVIIPAAVYDEVVADGADRAGAAELSAAHWIEVAPAPALPFTAELSHSLGLGETEAIRIAIARGADLLLVDDLRARRAAMQLGVTVIGVVGVLVEAKRRGLVSHVKPILDSIAERVDFRIDARLYQTVLQSVGE